MPVQFSVLASGSRGNSTLVEAGGPGLLIDVGLGPRKLAARLATAGAGWERVGAVLLTHTHGDHVDNLTLHNLARRQIKFWCHDGQRPMLQRLSGFQALEEAGLTRPYDDRPFLLPFGWRVEPIELSHDGGPTFGFRIEARPSRRAAWVGMGYLADTGKWSAKMAEALVDVELLGVEFNHDAELQIKSGRPPILIRRILGDRGHLSNDQGAGLVSAVLDRSKQGRLKHVVLLHLSEDCNRPHLALESAKEAIRAAGRRCEVLVAQQHDAHPSVCLARARNPRNARAAEPRPEQPKLPPTLPLLL